VRLAGASQRALNTSAEAIKSYLLCRKENTHPIQSFSTRELSWLCRTAEGFLAQRWSLPRAWPRGLVTDVLWGQSHSRNGCAIWTVLPAGTRTGLGLTRSAAMPSEVQLFANLPLWKRFAKSHSKGERWGGFPPAVVVKGMSSEKVSQ